MFAFYVAEFDTFGSPLVQRETSLNSRLRTCQKTPELDLKKLGLCMYAAHLCKGATAPRCFRCVERVADGSLSADLCKLPVLLLLPNERFSGFLYCTGFVGYLKAQRCPKHGHYGCPKVGFSTIARLMVFRHHF